MNARNTKSGKGQFQELYITDQSQSAATLAVPHLIMDRFGNSRYAVRRRCQPNISKYAGQTCIHSTLPSAVLQFHCTVEQMVFVLNLVIERAPLAAETVAVA